MATRPGTIRAGRCRKCRFDATRDSPDDRHSPARRCRGPAGRAPAEPQPRKPKKKQDSFLVFLIKLVRDRRCCSARCCSPVHIPSESMMPRLLVGDYLFAAKWPYGYSQRLAAVRRAASSPGRVFASQPERGDVVIFKHPDRPHRLRQARDRPARRPGADGRGRAPPQRPPVPKRADRRFRSPDPRRRRSCRVAALRRERPADGSFVCRYPQFRETLPGGVSYNVLDLGLPPQDTTAARRRARRPAVPDGRQPRQLARQPLPRGAQAGHRPGPVREPGRARRASCSSRPTARAEWIKPWTWFTAARWSRIGHGI